MIEDNFLGHASLAGASVQCSMLSQDVGYRYGLRISTSRFGATHEPQLAFHASDTNSQSQRSENIPAPINQQSITQAGTI